MFKKALSVIVVATMALSAGIVRAAEKWDMATPYPDATFHTRNIVEFARDVNDATGGELMITVHSGGSLFRHGDIKRSVQRGLVPIGETMISLLSNENPLYAVDAIPFLATSYEDARKLWAVSRGFIEAALAGDGLKVLYVVPWPPQGLYTARQVKSIYDLKGVKFRVYNATAAQLADLTGMVATRVEVPEIPIAFSTGIVEAMMSSPTTGVNSKAWDFVSNFYDVQAWLPKMMVIVNARSFGRLPESVQKAVTDAAARAEARGLEMSMAESEEKKKILSRNGVNVLAPTQELKAGLSRVGESMIASWLAQTGDDGQAIVDAFRK